MCIPRPSAQRGFTLMELIFMIVVLGLGLAGVLLLYTTGVRGSADPLLTKQALAAAEAMLDEIQLNAFCNPDGGFTSGNPAAPAQVERQNFDDVGDYNNFQTTGIYSIDGAVPVSGLERFNLSVAVAPAALGTVAAGDAMQITVTVSGPGGLNLALAGYRSDYAGVCP